MSQPNKFRGSSNFKNGQSKQSTPKTVWKPKQVLKNEEKNNKPEYDLDSAVMIDILLQIPLEVLFHVANLLDVKSLCNLSAVNKSYHELVNVIFSQYKSLDIKMCIAKQDTINQKVQYLFGKLSRKNWMEGRLTKMELMRKKDRYYMPKVKFDSSKIVCSFGSEVHVWDLDEKSTMQHKRLQHASGFSHRNDNSYIPQETFNEDIHYNQKRQKNLNSFLKSVDSTGTKIWAPHRGDITDLHLLEGSKVITSSVDHSIAMWNLNEPKKRTFFDGHKDVVQTLNVEGNSLCSGSLDATVKLWNLNSTKSKKSYDIHERPWCIKMNQQKIIVGTSWTKNEGSLVAIDIQTGTKESLNKHTGAVYDIQWADESKNTMLTAGYDAKIILWDFRAKEKQILMIEDPDDYALYCMGFHPQAQRLVVGTALHSAVRVFNLRMPKTCMQTIFVDQSRYSEGVVYSLQQDDASLCVALPSALFYCSFLC